MLGGAGYWPGVYETLALTPRTGKKLKTLKVFFPFYTKKVCFMSKHLLLIYKNVRIKYMETGGCLKGRFSITT